MKLLSSLFALGLVACSITRGSDGTTTSDLAGVSPGQIRGVPAINEALRSRLFVAVPDPGQFDVARVAGGQVSRAQKTAGAFAPTSDGVGYTGGTPTPTGVSLWYLIAARLGEGLGMACATGPGALPERATFTHYATPSIGQPDTTAPFVLRSDAVQIVHAVCTYEDGVSSAGAFFDLLMGPGASGAAERAAFVTAFQNDHSAPAERVQAMTIAVMLNPLFLLER